VRFEAQGAPLVTMACHCIGCQRMTGGAFSLSSLYPDDRFQILEGETVRGGLKTGPNHRFCASCMSWLYTVPDGFEGFANVRSSLFADAAEHRPYVEMWTREALPLAQSGAEVKYETVPDEAQFGDLMASYAEWDGRVKQ
jgi:hypothetical protein